MINKNLFKLTFLFLILAELLSFFGWLLPEFNTICFFVILFLTLILSLKKLEYGLYIIFAELFIGSYGYLFSLDFDGVKLSIRIGLFLVVMSVWLVKFLKNIFSTLIGILLSFVVIVVTLIGVLSASSEYQKKEKKIDKNTILKN